MAQHFAVLDRMTDGDYEAFHTLLEDRHTTIKSAKAWLMARGFMASRSAVARYMKRRRDSSLFKFRLVTGLTDKGMRRAINTAAKHLRGRDLEQLAVYSVFLLNLPSASRAVLPMPGVASMEEAGNRPSNGL